MHRTDNELADAIIELFGQENAHQFDLHGRAAVPNPHCLVCGQNLPQGDPLVFTRISRHRSATGFDFAVVYGAVTITVAERWEDALEVARGVDRAIMAALEEGRVPTGPAGRPS